MHAADPLSPGTGQSASGRRQIPVPGGASALSMVAPSPQIKELLS